MQGSVNDIVIGSLPPAYEKIKEATDELRFGMAADVDTGRLLRTLAASKPSGRFLEFGTGTGLATAWIADGLDENSSLISIDSDEVLLNVGKEYIKERR